MCSINAAGPGLQQGGPGTTGRVLWPTHRQLLLQADAERLGVVGFQLLQGHSRLPNELIVAEFVLIAHGDPGGQGHGQLFRHRVLSPGFQNQRGFASARWGVDKAGVGVWGGSLRPGPSPTAGSFESCLHL